MSSEKREYKDNLEGFLRSSILPALNKTHLGNLTLHLSSPRADLIDAQIFSKGKNPLAELRLDLLGSPAVLHLFIHHYPLDDSLKDLLGSRKKELESNLRKKISIDSAYSDALHRVTHSMQLVAKEVEEFRIRQIIMEIRPMALLEIEFNIFGKFS